MSARRCPPSSRALSAAVREEAGIPAAVGFGISTPERAAEVGEIADGVIIGSRLVRAAGEAGTDPDAAAAAVSGFIAETRELLAAGSAQR